MTAKIHMPRGLKEMTERQSETAGRLAARGVYVYAERVTGEGVVKSFERYLRTGDSAKITKALYHYLTMSCGFIAHYSLEGFRSRYSDPADLLDRRHDAYGPLFGNPTNAPVTHSQHVYSDGLTTSDIWRGMERVAAMLSAEVYERRERTTEEYELAVARSLAERYGYRLARLAEQ